MKSIIFLFDYNSGFVKYDFALPFYILLDVLVHYFAKFFYRLKKVNPFS